jgi:tRNA dimethylallyltransferase
MLTAGLADEVRALRRLPRPLSREAAQALGYKELFDYLDGKASLAETTERIRVRSRNYAKRQVTWFRHLPGCRAVTPQLTFALWGLTMAGDVGRAHD